MSSGEVSLHFKIFSKTLNLLSFRLELEFHILLLVRVFKRLTHKNDVLSFFQPNIES